MERRIKERLIGASVLVMIAVIFIPMMLDDSVPPEQSITETNIPPRPEDGFTSRIIPLPVEQGGKSRSTRIPRASESAPLEAVTTSSESASDTGDVARQDSSREAAAVSSVVEEKPASDGSAKSPESHANEERVGLTAWVVQLGSFSSEANANSLSEKARQAGFAAFVDPLKSEKGVAYRVRVGPELRRSDAATLRDRLKQTLDVDAIVISYP